MRRHGERMRHYEECMSRYAKCISRFRWESQISVIENKIKKKWTPPKEIIQTPDVKYNI